MSKKARLELKRKLELMGNKENLCEVGISEVSNFQEKIDTLNSVGQQHLDPFEEEEG